MQFLTEAGVGVDPAVLREAMPLVRERMRTFAEAVELLRFLFTDDIVPNEKARGLIEKAPDGVPQGGGRGARCSGGMGRRDDRRGAGYARRRGGALPHEGVAADPSRGHGVERVAAACRSRWRCSDTSARSRGCAPRPEASIVALLLLSQMLGLIGSVPPPASA